MQKRKHIKPIKFPSTSTDDDGEVSLPEKKRLSGGEEYFGSLLRKRKPDEKEPAAKAAPAVSAAPADRKIVSLEDRTLTKKQQKSLDDWKTSQRGRPMDALIEGIVEDARRTHGHGSVLIGDSVRNLIIVVPCPSLAFEFLICQDGFPLSLIFQIVSKHGAGKSALLAEFGRWFHKVGGGLILCENESKINDLWYESILGSEVWPDHVPLLRSKSLEQWQRMITDTVKSTKRQMIGTADKPGPGRTIPILFGVDSVMGKMSERTQEKILGEQLESGLRGSKGEGAATLSHPVEANLITMYMKTIPQELDNWPFSLVLINHLKSKQDDAGNEVRSIAGGRQIGFQESFELEIRKLGGKGQIRSSDFTGNLIEISCEKNSFGPTFRKITTRLIWWHEKDPVTGLAKQKSVWDWDWSTVCLLDDLMRGNYVDPYLRRCLKESDFHLECPKRSAIENTAWSKTLGMKEGDAAPWYQVGAMIREDDKLMNHLRDVLKIARRPLLRGDYLEQLDDLKKSLP